MENSVVWLEEPIVDECQVCLSKKQIKDVCIGMNKRAGYQRIRLCESCRALLAIRLIKSVE